MLRCRVVLGALLAALTVVAVAPGEAQAAPHSSTFTVNRRDSDLGGSFRFAGSVPTAPAGKAVVLEVFSAGRWQTAALTRTNSARAYVVFYRAPRVGNFPMRLRVPASNGRTTQVSPTITVSVFRWIYLTDTRPAECDTGGCANGVNTMNGVSYPNSWDWRLYGRGTRSRGYDLGRKCVSLSVVVGADDGARSDSAAFVSIRTDGVERYSGQFRLGQATRVNLPLNGYLRLTFEGRGASGGFSSMAFGNPQVRCLR